MRVLKIFGGIVLFVVLLFVFVANFSIVESRYECSGKITVNQLEQPAKIFLKMERYRWWVGLWSDSIGTAWVELPNQYVTNFNSITESGDLLQLWEYSGKFGGSFSILSSTIGVDLGGFGVFEGNCKGIQQ